MTSNMFHRATHLGRQALRSAAVMSFLFALLYATTASSQAALPATQVQFRDHAPGVRHATLMDGGAEAFELDLTRIELTVVEAREQGRPTSVVADLGPAAKALFAVNGGYFDERGRPLGLLVSRGKSLNRLRRTDWGVLSVDAQGRAALVHTRDYRPKATPEFAVQAGPRLVVDGEILKLKAQWDRRTAIGITTDPSRVVIIVTRTAVSLDALAHLFKDELGCPFALNLDGGSSTQLWADGGALTAIPGFAVANAVAALPRVPAPARAP